MFGRKYNGFGIKTKSDAWGYLSFALDMDTIDLEILKKIAEGVASDPCLSREHQCGKFTELAYLCHFVQCYKPSLHIADWQFQSVYIMEDAETRIGIAFCDLQLPLNLGPDQEIKVPGNVTNTAVTNGMQELWLVFVAKEVEQCGPFFSDLVSAHNLSAIFDKIFLFNFFKSAIQTIK